MFFWVKLEVDIYEENDWVTYRCFVIQQWRLLLPTKYWPGKASERKLSKWIRTPKNLQTYIPTNSPLPPLLQKNPPNQNIQPSNFNFFFLVKLHLKCSVKGHVYKFQEWEQILHASFLLCSGDYVLLTSEDSKMLSCNRAHQETLPRVMELWIEWMQSTSCNRGCKMETRNKSLL